MGNLEAALIDLSTRERGFAAEIRDLGGAGVLECIQCGKCAGVCPLALAGFTFFSKKVIRAVAMGLREALLDDASIWACQSCNRCTEICPRGSSPFQVMLAMRRVAMREYAIPALATDGLKSLYDYGHAVYLKNAGETRRKVGLPETPPSTLADPAALGEVRAILRKSVLAELDLIPMGDDPERAEVCEV
ncbi:MAG: 4Fe-4S dicluster domain-containing protein [Peptococcaceae bacterium]|jgi:heterodisulfide reductase subunit C|nr:4Fe-4S dicluster domain-containing protein [Peptococcaceae bacterium]